MIGHIVHKADFEKALASPSRIRSAHFALHHLAQGPARASAAELNRSQQPVEAAIPSLDTELSTDSGCLVQPPVDSLAGAHWLGYVVPKRHARRAVTRSLLKRQIRSVFQRHAAALPKGLWLVRLRQPFAPAEFVSACSPALRAAARTELEGLLTRCHAAGRP